MKYVLGAESATSLVRSKSRDWESFICGTGPNEVGEQPMSDQGRR
jgi:hypothetical protein